jgi:hypothetical protein
MEVSRISAVELLLAMARYRPSGDQAMAATQSEFVLKVEIGLPVVASHIRIVLSPQVEAMRSPWGDHAADKTEKLGVKP